MHQSSEADHLTQLLQRFLDIHAGIAAFLPAQFLEEELGLCRKFAEQLQHEEFPIAFTGLSGRGKSTIINALLEKKLLPTGVSPRPDFACIIRQGKRDLAQVIYRNHPSRYLADLGQARAYLQGQPDPAAPADTITCLEIRLQDTAFPDKFALVDFPAIDTATQEQHAASHEFIRAEAKAWVLCLNAADADLQSPLLQSFFQQIQHDNPELFKRCFVLINQWDKVDTGLQAQAEADLNAAIKTAGYEFANHRIYKVSALNFQILNQEISTDTGLQREVDNLLVYADLDSIFADPHGLIEQHAELSEFKRFKANLIKFINQTAAAELNDNARTALIKAIVVLNSHLHENAELSLDPAEQEKYLHNQREDYVDTILVQFKQDITGILQRFENDLTDAAPQVWHEGVQKDLLTDIRKLLLDPEQGLARQIIPGLGKGGIAVPQISKFVTEVFEAVQLDRRMIEAMEKTARTHEKLDRLKFELQQPFRQFWFDSLDKRVDAVLNPEYIVMRIYGILENLITWRVWHRDIENKLDAANLENIDKIIAEIDVFFSRNQEKIRERVQQTIKYHFQRYVIPKLKDIFSLQLGDANELTVGLKNRIRNTIDEPGNSYNDEYQNLMAAIQAQQQALAQLSSLKQELYQL